MTIKEFKELLNKYDENTVISVYDDNTCDVSDINYIELYDGEIQIRFN